MYLSDFDNDDKRQIRIECIDTKGMTIWSKAFTDVAAYAYGWEIESSKNGRILLSETIREEDEVYGYTKLSKIDFQGNVI